MIFFTLFFLYWIWFSVKASGNFQSRSGALNHFHNGINDGDTKQASDGYCWVISLLFVCFLLRSVCSARC